MAARPETSTHDLSLFGGGGGEVVSLPLTSDGRVTVPEDGDVIALDDEPDTAPAESTAPAVAADERLVATFAKNSFEEVRASLSTYRGRRGADLRVWQKMGGKWFPTKRGVWVSVDLLPDLALGVASLGKAFAEERVQSALADEPVDADGEVVE